MESKGGKIALLIFMAAILVYTVINYINGKTSIFLLCLAVLIALTSGRKVLESLIEDFKEGR